MVERLLLDGVYAETARAAVGHQFHLIVQPLAHVAKTPLPLLQVAVARTQVALQAAVVHAMPITGADN